MKIVEIYRPRLHFSPQRGWINDPNGLIVVDGVYHLFFQHDPHSITNGPMHWGYASSTDLTTWTEHPVALFPTDLGTCYSGSAVDAGDAGIKLFYTAHSSTSDGKDFETQCLVHANRSLTKFVGEPSNPVIPNPGIEAFRDPKVIWHGQSGRWIMLLTLGQEIGFYESTDFLKWTFLSSFGKNDGRHSTSPWECPDLVELHGPDGKRHWVLIVGVSTNAYAEGSGTQYFVGKFDGETFANANPPETELWLDYGRDYYATQSFHYPSAYEPLVLAWASNWCYAKQTPTTAFRGAMSLPRELRLVEGEHGLRVAMKVPVKAHLRFPLYDAPEAREGVYRLETLIHIAPGEGYSITLFGESVPQFIISRTSRLRGVIHARREAIVGLDAFAHDYSVGLNWPGGGLDLNIYVDRGLVEISAADGQIWMTNVYFPASPCGSVVMTKIDGGLARSEESAAPIAADMATACDVE